MTLDQRTHARNDSLLMNEWHLDIPSVNDADSSLNQIDPIPKWDTTTRGKIDPNFCAQVGWLCWGLTSQSTIFQSCRDGAIASWVINQYFRGVKCLAQGHNTAAVGFEPRTSRSGVRHSTTEPPRSPCARVNGSYLYDCEVPHVDIYGRVLIG